MVTRQILLIIFHFGWTDARGFVGATLLYLSMHPGRSIGIALGICLTLMSIYEKYLQIKKLNNEKKNRPK